MPRTPGRAKSRPRSSRPPHPATSFSTSLSSLRPSLDARRYAAFRSGLTPEEIATRENVSLATITRSIERMKIESQLSSKEAVETATRRAVLSALPTAANSLIAALTATRDKILETMDADGNGTVEVIQEADHALRLRALDSLTKLIDSTKESSPMISANFNNQNLQQNNTAITTGGVSTESLIRQIREERGLVTQQERAAASPDTIQLLPDTIDFELQQEIAEGEVVLDDEPDSEVKS